MLIAMAQNLDAIRWSALTLAACLELRLQITWVHSKLPACMLFRAIGTGLDRVCGCSRGFVRKPQSSELMAANFVFLRWQCIILYSCCKYIKHV